MFTVEQKEQKVWLLNFGDDSVELKLSSSSITNKFIIVATFIESMSNTLGDEFNTWFKEFMISYRDAEIESQFEIIEKNVPKIKEYVNLHLEKRGIDFTQFVDETKVKKTSILFMPDEIKKIAQASGYLKVYALIFNTENLKLSPKLHKKVYNLFSDDIMDSEVVFKIFNVIKTKTFKYSLTDKFMWDYIKMIQCKTIDTHVIEIFNFIMNNIMIMCEENKNPITYFVSVIEESVKWFLRSVYKESVIYDDSISTEDIHQSNNIDNLKIYTYGDTVGRLKRVAFEQICNELEDESSQIFDSEFDKSITNFQNKISQIQYISPLCECVVFPILSRITTIPYNHFKSISPSEAMLLSLYIQSLMRKVFKNEYKEIISLLNYYPTNQPSMATTYKIKSISDYIKKANETKNFYGFNTKTLPHKTLNFFIGRISRGNFCNIFDNKKLSGIPLSKVEKEMICFFIDFFSGKMNDDLIKMREMMSVVF
jgi:hypothetical protein